MSAEPKFTPGPWETIDSDEPQLANFHSAIYGPAGEYDALFVAMANQNGRYPADAHLIAAAPDMLEALEYAREKMWEYGFSENDLQPIRIAISKALGGAS